MVAVNAERIGCLAPLKVSVLVVLAAMEQSMVDPSLFVAVAVNGVRALFVMAIDETLSDTSSIVTSTNARLFSNDATLTVTEAIYSSQIT
jgi:hypothetical protein